MHVVIPLAGRASRFKEEGFTLPKPFISVRGKPMVQWATDSLPFVTPEQLIFVCLREHEETFGMTKKLHELYSSKVTVLTVDTILDGAVMTVLAARSLIDTTEELIVYNADQYFDVAPFVQARKACQLTVTGLIPVFEATHPRWSFAKTTDDGRVIEVAEKVPISNHATVGLYYFSHGADFVWAADEMIRKDIRRNNEFYVCPVYNELISRGDMIKIVPVNFMWSLGTPEDVRYFEKYYKEAV